MTTFAAISLTSPLMLLGAAAVAGPIVAHLMNRRTRRKIVFPTITLLQQASASQSTLFRLRRLILLALRCAAIVLIAWAFARPVWVDAEPAASGDGDSLGVMIVADVSASMAQRIDGVSAMHHLRAEAHRVLDDLTPGRDVANLIRADARPRPAFEELIANLPALRRDIDALAPTHERADLSAAVALAAERLQQHDGPRRIVVISDMQATNWADLVFDTAGFQGHLTVIQTPRGAASNLAVHRPRVSPVRPIAHQPAQVIVPVVNDSARQRSTTVTLHVNDNAVVSQQITLEPGDRREVSFAMTFDAPGRHRLIAAGDAPDALDLDDTAYAVAEVVDRATVVIVSDDDPTQPTGPSFYLQRALAPRGDDEDPLRLRTLRLDDVTNTALAGADAVLLADLARPSTTTPMQALADYVQRGGGAAYFLGPGLSPGVTQQNLADLSRVMTLPYRPVELIEHDPALRFGEGAWSSPPLNVFDETSRFALQRIPFTRTYSTTDSRDDAFVLLRFSDGSPALASMPQGAGRLVLANFSPSPRGGDLAKRGVFVPLIHSLVDFLRHTASPRPALRAGQSHAVAVPSPDGRYRVNDPAGQPLRVQLAGDSLQLPPLTEPGFYTIQRAGEPFEILAVNLDPRESRLARIDTPTAQALLGGGAGAGDQIDIRSAGDAAGIEDRGVPLWPWCVGAAMAMLGAEMILLRVVRS